MSYCRAYPEELGLDVYVLRLGHRPGRDKRITTHVVLVARAFGARGIYIANVVDESIKKSIEKVVQRWGGKYFTLVMGVDPMKIVKEFKKDGGCVVHLTMYGLPVDDVINSIRERCRKILVIVGAEKVERIYYELADYNISIGNQPHSEVSALALFLDRLWNGVELKMCFKDAKYYIVPSVRGKVVKMVDRGSSA
ncbi:MAG: tRNA (cytidine(56)-2'-O)-methyltransferase [Desulfurococcaceae archaeon]|jgi:tRNA (cytidine56-2'-O)-methyltransferase|nr:tRNA (cytidine(56)-2'-O)-methyltransferase [Desulfurococcaceae archaeon]MCC6057620.1 tRNA (cytidine(56)-2'-O)-methyltransferase [Desulfurococcaceae archaeon]